MVVAKKNSQKKTKPSSQQQQNVENNNNNNNNNNDGEIQNRDQLPVLPTRMEVRRARINEKKKRKEIKKEDRDYKSVVVNNDNNENASSSAEGSNPFSVGSLLAAAAKAKKKGVHKKLIARLNAATATMRSKSETTANLSDKQRERIFVSEIQHIQKVQSNPVFQNDPLGSLQQHLQGTAKMLQAPNAECRREPRTAIRSNTRNNVNNRRR